MALNFISIETIKEKTNAIFRDYPIKKAGFSQLFIFFKI